MKITVEIPKLFQIACFILGSVFVVSIVIIFARLAYLLMIADACIK